eukprot:9163852-Pyramimonas_sp.AAC.1
MARYFSTAATRMSYLCKCKLGPRECYKEIRALSPLGIRAVPGFKCRAVFVNHQHTMRVLYAVALATTEKTKGIRVQPAWGSVPKPIWQPPKLAENLSTTVRPSDIVAKAAAATEHVSVVRRAHHVTTVK